MRREGRAGQELGRKFGAPRVLRQNDSAQPTMPKHQVEQVV